MFYNNSIAKQQKQPTAMKKRLNKLRFILNGVLSSCQRMRQLLGTDVETAKIQYSAGRGGQGAGAEQSIQCILICGNTNKKNTYKMFILAQALSGKIHTGVSNPGSWGEQGAMRPGGGERGILSTLQLFIHTESSTVCTGCLSHKLI